MLKWGKHLTFQDITESSFTSIDISFASDTSTEYSNPYKRRFEKQSWKSLKTLQAELPTKERRQQRDTTRVRRRWLLHELEILRHEKLATLAHHPPYTQFHQVPINVLFCSIGIYAQSVDPFLKQPPSLIESYVLLEAVRTLVYSSSNLFPHMFFTACLVNFRFFFHLLPN